VNKTWWAEKW